MSNAVKPVVFIAVAIAVAAGAAMFLSRSSSNSEALVKSGMVAPPGGGRIRGPEQARVTLVEFGDYQCPSCAFYHPMVGEVLRRYPQQVRLEYHHYPLVSIHANAMPAAMAAEAAGAQGRFWEMHDLLFEQQDIWAQSRNPEAELLAFANRLGLNADSFMQTMRSPDVQQRVLEDVMKAGELNIDAVPAFFINGQRIRTPENLDEFVNVVESHLRAAETSTGSTAPQEK